MSCCVEKVITFTPRSLTQRDKFNLKTLIKMDNELIRRFNERDEIAFKLVFCSLYQKLVNYANSFIDDYHESEDVVLIIFRRLWVSDVKFDAYEKIRSYLYKSVKRLCLSYLKSVRRRYRSAKDIDTIETIMPSGELTKELYAAINQLPDHYKRLIKLGMEGFSDKEISKIENIKIETVHIKRWRAIKLLRSLLNR